MAISSNNVQVYTTLSKELVAEIDFLMFSLNYKAHVSHTYFQY